MRRAEISFDALDTDSGELMRAGSMRRPPAVTRALRGRKRRAKTDREDARWLRELLAEGRLPAAWIPSGRVRQ